MSVQPGQRYESGARVIEVLSDAEGGYLVRVLDDPDTETVGAEFVLSPASLGACYNPAIPDPPLTD